MAARLPRVWKRTALGQHWAIQSRYVTISCRFSNNWHFVGGCCCSRTLSQIGWNSCAMHLSEGKLGPFGGGRCGCWSRVIDCWASAGWNCRRQCTTTRVRFHLVFIIMSISSSFRLNVPLSSIVASKPFQMPVEVLPRAMYGTDNES